MLIIVLFAVIETRGTSMNMVWPMKRNVPTGQHRKLFICNQGTIRFLDLALPADTLTGTLPDSMTTTEQIIAWGNGLDIRNSFFTYRFDYENRRVNTEYGFTRTVRSIYCNVEERPDAVGETSEQIISPTSEFITALDGFDPDSCWIAFAVDGNSLDIYRAARKICAERGFAIGWDPGGLEFPLKVVWSSSSRGSDTPSNALDGIQYNNGGGN